jgi:hypothetical protein
VTSNIDWRENIRHQFTFHFQEVGWLDLLCGKKMGTPNNPFDLEFYGVWCVKYYTCTYTPSVKSQAKRTLIKFPKKTIILCNIIWKYLSRCI